MLGRSSADRGWGVRGWTGLVLAGVVALGACKDATLGPERNGDLEGRVEDFVTGEAVVGASITTAPPTEALLSDGDGAFRLEDLEVGTYQVTARKSGYTPTTVSVAVREDRVARAAILLEQEEEEDEEVVEFSVQVVDFWNTQSGDSTFVETEYRVENTGDVALSAYEVYFRIETGSNPFFHEEEAEELGVGQADTGRFRVFLPGSSATDVQVDGRWSDPALTRTDGGGGG
jgi:hypothetical protein